MRIAIACLAALLSLPVVAQQPAAPKCDRACLQKWVDNYLVAMRDQKADPALFAPDLQVHRERRPPALRQRRAVVRHERHRQLQVLCAGHRDPAGRLPRHGAREAARPQTDGDLVAIALRLKIRNQRITEIEQIVSRPSNVNSSRGDFPPTGQGVEAMGAPHPMFTTPIPEKERESRAELIETANYYFTGLEKNDGKGYYPFTDDCVRFENAVDVLARSGTRTTCKKQFEEGLKGIVDRVRDRRFVAVDRERGIVFAFAFFDHHRINWTWQIAELFRIENGQIRRIEAIFHRAPFGMASGWSTYEQAMSSEVQDVR